MVNLAQLGLWVSIPFLGYLIELFLQNKVQKETKTDLSHLFLMMVCGIAIWSLFLIGSVLLGIYNSEVFGYLGWLISLIGLYFIGKGLRSKKFKLNIDISESIFVIGLLVLIVFSIIYPNENVLGGRDQGVYANTGIYIANHGGIDPNYPLLNAEDFYDFFLSGLYVTPEHMTIQFSHLYSTWLAHGYSTFGIEGLFRVNTLFLFFSLIMLRYITQIFMEKPYAIMATLFLGFNLSQLWISRMTLSETLTQVFVLGAALSLIISLQNKNGVFAYLSGFLWGVTYLVRIDVYLFFPMLIFSHIIFNLLKKEISPSEKAVWNKLHIINAVFILLSVPYYYYFSKPYFLGLSDQLLKIGLLSIFLLIILFIISKLKIKVSSSKYLYYGLLCLSLIAIIYAHLIRPHIGPFSTYDWPGSFLDGTRNYRENSIINICLYLSIPIFYAAVGGLLAALYRIMFKKEWGLIPLIVLIGGFSALYLYDPQISPDQYWAIRRFIPIIIPGITFLAFYGLYNFTSLFSNNRRKFLLIIISLSLFIYVFQQDKALISVKENNNSWNQVATIANKIPDNSIVISNADDTINTPLFMAFDKKIIQLNHLRESSYKKLLNEINKQKDTNVFLLDNIGVFGYGREKVEDFDLRFSNLEQVPNKLPSEMVENQYHLGLYKLSNLDKQQNSILGAYPVIGVEESGFYNTEVDSLGVPFRWTNGKGVLVIPVEPDYQSSSVQISINNIGPQPQDIKITANSQNLFSGIINGPTEKILSLHDIKSSDNKIVLEIQSNVWNPAQVIEGTNDTRDLGVAVKMVRIIDSSITPNFALNNVKTNIQLEDSNNLSINPVDSKSISINLANNGAHFLPSFSYLGTNIHSVNIGQIWFDKNDMSHRLSEGRVHLPSSLFPNDNIQTKIELSPIGYDGKPLPPGDYEVWIGLVQEGVGWFYDFGEMPIKINVHINS
ncbi:hypothetical protein [Paenibacillus sp. 32352]|uniref:hypothetical protein n=1 Tax=Paenibacillus sp. 32352 TaxID=1969111 RepID=UPI0009ADD623|nr:hypothetical protein [Paenibacillus sp. 32352]